MPSSTRKSSSRTPEKRRRRRAKSIEMPRRRRSRSRSRSKSRSRSGTKQVDRVLRSPSPVMATSRRYMLDITQHLNFNHSHISPEGLKRLRSYRHVSENQSLLSNYVYQPVWSAMSRRVPLWVAPNVITLLGFLVGMLGPLVTFYFLKTGEEYPGWVWGLSAVTLSFYATCDALDGLQARRTNTSSPLGEFLDHGLDACITQFIFINLSIAVGMPPWMETLLCLQTVSGLFLCVLEQYSTGVFSLGYISGPTEGITCAIAQFLLTAIYTRNFWNWYPFGAFRVPCPPAVLQFVQFHYSVELTSSDSFDFGSLRSFVCLIYCVAWALTVVSNVYHMVQRSRKGRKTLFALLPMVAPVVCHLYLYEQYSVIHKEFFPWFELSIGMLDVICCAKMCLARITGCVYNPFHLYYYTFLMFHFGFHALHALNPTYSVQLNCGVLVAYLTIIGFFCYIHLMISVARQIKRYTGKPIFSLSRKRYF